MRSVYSAVLLSIVALALAACSGSRDQAVGHLNCPAAFIAPGLDAYTMFRPGVTPTTNANDIVFGVKFVSVQSVCHSEPEGIRVDTSLTFFAVRNDDNFRQGDFTYFVAVADARQNIVAKQNFALRVDFAPRQKQMRIFDEITEHLPLKNVSLGSNYAIIVGLQVSRQQLDLNRRRE
ncbi:MAG TPA: hypothetical protein VE397_05435 [Stellaceae bacterium]|jgi:hypothetical protein|nr:hypothetical protein [Stellaceae bacterium]